MSNEQAAPGSKGVAVELLATVDLGPGIEGMAGRELRMRLATIEPGANSARFTTIKADRALPSSCRERSPPKCNFYGIWPGRGLARKQEHHMLA